MSQVQCSSQPDLHDVSPVTLSEDPVAGGDQDHQQQQCQQQAGYKPGNFFFAGLYEMIIDDSNSEIVEWADGHLRVYDSVYFESKLLPRYLELGTMESFESAHIFQNKKTLSYRHRATTSDIRSLLFLNHDVQYHLITFPIGLFKMLRECSNSEIIEWADDQIKIHDSSRLEIEVFPRYFETLRKTGHFFSRLNDYSFFKVGRARKPPICYKNTATISDLRSLLFLKTRESTRKRTSKPC